MNAIAATAATLSAIPVASAFTADPIFALIEEHRAAAAISWQLAQEENEIESRVPMPVRTGWPGVELGETRAMTLIIDGKESFIPSRPYHANNHADIDRDIDYRLSDLASHDAAGAAALEARRAALHADLTKQEDTRTSPQLEEIEKKLEAAQDTEREVAQRLLATQPASLAGVAALIRYAVESEGTYAPVPTDADEGDDTYVLLSTIADALKKLGVS